MVCSHALLPVDDWINSRPSRQGEWGNCCHEGASDMLQKTNQKMIASIIVYHHLSKKNKTYLAN